MRNTLKLIIRSLLRNPVTSLINLFGLTISLTLVIVLSTYSFSEFNTDKFHKNHKNIYLIEPTKGWVFTPAILKDAIDNNLTGIEKSIRIREKWKAPVYQFRKEDPVKSNLIFADNDFFEVFDYKAIEGNLRNALAEPMSVVISKTLATRLFGNKNAVGEIIRLDNLHDLTVTAVLENQPSNTIFSFHSICNIETIKRVQPNKGDFTMWDYRNYQTFVLLKPKTKPNEVCQSIINLIPDNVSENYDSARLMPFDSIYFSELKSSFGYFKIGNKSKVMFFSIISFLVLLVALINYINITTARWNEKIKQTGVLKIIGAKNSTITFNLLLETSLFFITAFIFALILVNIISPFLFQTTSIQFDLNLFYTSSYILFATTGVLLLGILCAIFPSLQIAKSNMLLNLKNKVKVTGENSITKGAMVSLQFVVAIVLILVTILVQKQVKFGSNSLGLNDGNIVGIELTPELLNKRGVLHDVLLSHSSVENVTFTQYYPGENTTSGWGLELRQNGEEKHVEFRTFNAESGFFDIMGLELVDGRFFDSNIVTDKNTVVVNEQFISEHGISNPIGARMSREAGLQYEIVGIVKDFNFKRVDEPIAPLVIRNGQGAFFALVKLNTTSFKALHNSYSEIINLTGELSPTQPPKISFLEDAIQKMYESEIMFRKAFTLFSLCAIVLSCLGILAMSMCTAQRRVKEIGIRKVNGAKISEILSMLNKDFIKWVAIAFVVACPIAWYAMNKWLENFAYKTTLSWWIFALAGVLALGIALLTVSFQSYKAATRNPIESLSYE